MTLWFFTLILFSYGNWLLLRQIDFKAIFIAPRQEAFGLKATVAQLQEIEELLGAGLLPSSTHWSGLEKLRAPWGRLVSESIQELRAQGGAVLPTLRRLKQLAQKHSELQKEAQSKSAQALAQALIAGILVPVFGVVLYGLLPGISERPWLWFFSCALAFCSSLIGAYWMLRMADSARWAGLKSKERPSVLGVQCAGEHLLALVRAGNPADMAWSHALEFLNAISPELGLEWGFSVWASHDDSALRAIHSPARRLLVELGWALRKSVQAGVMDGRPCTDRVETALRSFGQDLQASIDRELSVFPTHILKPLFIFVAPAILGLLAFGMFLAFAATSGGFNAL